MDRMIYTALSGLDAEMARQRAVANNLANAQTPGFKAEEFSILPVTLVGPQLETRAMASGAVRGADMQGGKIVPTGQPLDIALEGDALLAVQAGDGTEAYTRRGDLRIGLGGVLETGDGYPVIGNGGPVTIPPRMSVTLGSDGAIFVSDPAAADAPPQELDRLKLVSPAGSPIVKDLANLLRVDGGGILPVDEEASIQTGMLEQSNVDMSETLIEMIEAQRGFERRSKLFATAREIDEGGARLMSLQG